VTWRDQLLHDLKRDEGFRDRPYRDSAGVLTVGYGWNMETRPMRESEATARLSNDRDHAIRELARAFPWFEALSDNRRRALANMAFNLGLSRLRSFRKMLKALAEEDFETAANEALNSRWAEQVGNRADRIATLIRSG
jgi:lysozyme